MVVLTVCRKGVQQQPGEVELGHNPYDPANPSGPKRTHGGVVIDGRRAFEEQNVTNGIKGPTFLAGTGCDIVDGTAVDYMHTVLLGVVRKLMHLWFDSSHSKELFSLSKHTADVDSKLENIKPPHTISRVPRGIKEHLKFWKANELRSWLFYYSIPTLYDIMDGMFFQHFALLAEAIFLLNTNSISTEELLHCEKSLQLFCYLFGTLYGERYMTAVVHQLLHLPDVVRNLGPLWVYSCFAFEDTNGKLLDMVKGTKKPHLQIASNICTMLKIPELLQIISNQPAIVSFIEKLTLKKRVAANVSPITAAFSVVGTAHQFKLEGHHLSLLKNYLGYLPGKCFKFLRLQLHNILYQSKEYTFVCKRNSYTVMYKFSNKLLYGQIQYFLKCQEKCSCIELTCFCPAVYVAMIKNLRNTNYSFFSDDLSGVKMSHISTVALQSENFHIIPVTEIMEQCVFISFKDISDKGYVIRSPNRIECD